MQAQIRDNAKALQDYLTDLHSWQTQIKQKDSLLLQSNAKRETKKEEFPVRESYHGVFDSSSTNNKIEIVSSNSSTKKIKEMPKLEKVEEVEKMLVSKAKEIPSMKEGDKVGKEEKEKSVEEKEKGNNFLKQGDYPNAIKAYTLSVELDPFNALSFANRALVYLKMKEWEKAEEDCNDAIIADNKYSKAFARRGTARVAMKRYYEAIDDFQEVLTLEPGNKEAISELGKIDQIISSQKGNSTFKSPVSGITPISSSPSTTPSLTTTSSTGRKKIMIEEVGGEEEKPKEKKEEVKKVEKKEEKPKEVKTEKKIEFVDVAKKPDGIVEKKEEKTTSQTAKKKVPQAVRVFSIPIQVPKEPPATSFEFESIWNSVKSNTKSFYEYMKVIPPSSFSKIFSNSMNYDILASIIHLLDQQYQSDELSLVYEVLANLATIDRFEMNVRFLSSKDKEVVIKLLDLVEKVPNANTNELRQKYGVTK